MADAQTRKLARQLIGMDERLRHLETVPQLAHSSIDDSALPVYDAEGTVVARIGKQADGTWGAPPLSGPTPSAPLGVSAVGGPGAVTVSWAGEFETGAAPLDFDTLEVLVDGSLAGAIPNRDGGSVTLTVLEGTRYISARIRTLVPRHSSTTSPFAVEVGPAPDALFAEARERIEAAEGQIEQGRSDLEAERAAREAALADAEQALQDLQAQLDGIADSEELQGLRDQITAAQEAVGAAQADATAAKQAADAAQSTADDAAASALAAAGIAADKGRIFYQPEAPTGDDRSSNNLWIDSDDGRVYVWSGTAWEESQSEDLRDAAQAAVAAQQAAEAADSKAQAAAQAAAAADAKAQKAIEDAGTAQRTADQATLDAADAHNAAVSAREAAEEAAKDAAGRARVVYQDTAPEPSPDLLWFDTSDNNTPKVWDNRLGNEPRRNLVPNPTPLTYSGWAGPAGRVVEREGKRWFEATANGVATPYIFSSMVYEAFEKGEVVTFRAQVGSENHQGQKANLRVSAHVRNGNNYFRPAGGFQDVPVDEWGSVCITLPLPGEVPSDGGMDVSAVTSPMSVENGRLYMADVAIERGDTSHLPYFDGGTSALTRWEGEPHASASVYDGPQWVPLDDPGVDAAQAAADAAQARADAAYAEAESKATPEQAEGYAKAAADAAEAAAAADAKAKADAAERAAKEAAAADAKAKADAAQAAAEAAAKSEAGAARTAAEAEAKRLADLAEEAAKEAAAADATAKASAAKADAAADAKAKADQALADALAALETARGEISAEIRTSANGKNAITVSTAAPSTSTPGVVVGDTWWRVDGSGQIFGQWRWTGSAWSPVTIRSEVVANLDVGKLTVTGESRFTTAVVDRLFADIFAAHKITANELIIAALDENGEIKPDSVGSVQIRDGEISANKIHLLGDPNDPAEAALVATIASIMKLAVENLVVTDGAEINEAVLLKLAAEMITTGVLRTAEAGQRVVIDRNGVILYGIDDDGADYELVRIGPSGENLITAGATTISPSGVQAPAGSFDQLAVGGDSLADILAQLPRGMRAWGQLTSTSQLDGDTSDYARRGEIQTTLEAGRLYRIRLSEHFVEVTGGTNTNIVEELRYSFDGTPILHAANPASGNYRGIFARNPVFAGAATAVNGMEFMLDTGSWSAGRGFWLMWMIRPEVAGRPVRVLATSFYSPVLTIEDTGPSMPSTLKRWNDGDGGGSAPEPVDPDPVVVRRTQTWDAASFGGDTRNGTVYQGTLNPYGNRYGGWVFYPAMRSALAGSTIEKFEVYLENAHWYYGSGGTAVLYPNDGTYKGILGSGTTSANWPRYAGRWVTVPSSWHAQIANGTYKGVSVYTTNTGLTYYGQFKGSPTKFRVTYRK